MKRVWERVDEKRNERDEVEKDVSERNEREQGEQNMV